MAKPFLLLPISYVNPNIFTHKRADRELIKPSCPPHRALHANLAYLPRNHRRRRDRAAELRSRERPSIKEHPNRARQYHPITPAVLFHFTIPRNPRPSPSLADSLPFPRKRLRYRKRLWKSSLLWYLPGY